MLCGFEGGTVRVELEDEGRLGMTSFAPRRDGRSLLASI
jgi:hypothetical protein